MVVTCCSSTVPPLPPCNTLRWLGPTVPQDQGCGSWVCNTVPMPHNSLCLGLALRVTVFAAAERCADHLRPCPAHFVGWRQGGRASLSRTKRTFPQYLGTGTAHHLLKGMVSSEGGRMDHLPLTKMGGWALWTSAPKAAPKGSGRGGGALPATGLLHCAPRVGGGGVPAGQRARQRVDARRKCRH